MDGWDWGDIHVITGEWWLALIGLALLLIGLAVGYALGQSRERDRWRRRYAYDDTPPFDDGGSSKVL